MNLTSSRVTICHPVARRKIRANQVGFWDELLETSRDFQAFDFLRGLRGFA
jgi:hypothetical protein